jgi:hypothetical protein
VFPQEHRLFLSIFWWTASRVSSAWEEWLQDKHFQLFAAIDLQRFRNGLARRLAGSRLRSACLAVSSRLLFLKVDQHGRYSGADRQTERRQGAKTMKTNRLAGVLESEPRREEVLNRGAWVAVPCLVGGPVGLWQQQLYQAAYARAVALNAPWPPRHVTHPSVN